MNVRQNILKYVRENPKVTGTEIMLGIGKKPHTASLYQTLKRMVRDNQLFVTKNKKYVASPNLENVQYELPVSEKYKYAIKMKKPVGRPRKYSRPSELTPPQKPTREPSALERIFLAEIDYVDAGIESLKITRSYLERRVEQIRANGQS